MTTSKKSVSTRNLASRPGGNVKKMVRQMIDSTLEHKQSTLASPVGGGWTTAGAVFPVNQQIAQGDAINLRSGDLITVKKLVIRLDMVLTAAATSLSARFIVFHDNQANGALPAVNELLDTAFFMSTYHLFNKQRGRFKILSDKQHTLVSATNTAHLTTTFSFRLNHKVFFNDGTSAATNLGKGALFVLMIADGTPAGGWSYMPYLEYIDA